MFDWFDWFNRNSVVGDYYVEDVDESLLDRISELESRILKLEIENVELNNCLYEFENRIQAQIDNIHPVVYNVKNTNWDQ
jgi:hypothetical protein